MQIAQKLRIAQPTRYARNAARDRRQADIRKSDGASEESQERFRPWKTAIKKMGFGTFSIMDATKNLQLFFTVFDLLLGIFGSLALTVSSLGIINTLVMAILERRREIGVLKALGAADRDVRRLFFAEAGAMGLLGGIFGVVLGWADRPRADFWHERVFGAAAAASD